MDRQRLGVIDDVQARRLLIANGAAQDDAFVAVAIGPNDVGPFVDQVSVGIDTIGVWRDRIERRRHTAVASANASVNVFHASVAHLIRTGNFTTPCKASRAPSLISASDGWSPSPSSSIDIIPLNLRTRARTSAIEWPLTAWLIIEA